MSSDATNEDLKKWWEGKITWKKALGALVVILLITLCLYLSIVILGKIAKSHVLESREYVMDMPNGSLEFYSNPRAYNSTFRLGVREANKEDVERWEAWQEGKISLNLRQFENIFEKKFFDAKGQVQVWFLRDGDTAYLYPYAGADQTTGEALLPMSPTVAKNILGGTYEIKLPRHLGAVEYASVEKAYLEGKKYFTLDYLAKGHIFIGELNALNMIAGQVNAGNVYLK